MARRAEQVRLLAELLSARPRSRAVSARWRAEPGEPAGWWTLSWTDGPDMTTMSFWAREIVAAVPRLAGVLGPDNGDLAIVTADKVDQHLLYALPPS